MKEFANTWNDIDSWEKDLQTIKEGIIKGMKLDQMPKIDGNFNAKITNSRVFDGYIVENIRIESFPGFYVTGNLYRPVESKGRHAAILSPHGHLARQTSNSLCAVQMCCSCKNGSDCFCI